MIIILGTAGISGLCVLLLKFTKDIVVVIIYLPYAVPEKLVANART